MNAVRKASRMVESRFRLMLLYTGYQSEPGLNSGQPLHAAVKNARLKELLRNDGTSFFVQHPTHDK